MSSSRAMATMLPRVVSVQQAFKLAGHRGTDRAPGCSRRAGSAPASSRYRWMFDRSQPSTGLPRLQPTHRPRHAASNRSRSSAIAQPQRGQGWRRGQRGLDLIQSGRLVERPVLALGRLASRRASAVLDLVGRTPVEGGLDGALQRAHVGSGLASLRELARQHHRRIERIPHDQRPRSRRLAHHVAARGDVRPGRAHDERPGCGNDIMPLARSPRGRGPRMASFGAIVPVRWITTIGVKTDPVAWSIAFAREAAQDRAHGARRRAGGRDARSPEPLRRTMRQRPVGNGPTPRRRRRSPARTRRTLQQR